MSSIIRLDAVEVLGVGLNTSSRLTWNPTDRRLFKLGLEQSTAFRICAVVKIESQVQR